MSGQAGDKDSKWTTASVRLTVVERDKLRAVAQTEHRTLSQELRRLIEQHLNAEAA